MDEDLRKRLEVIERGIAEAQAATAVELAKFAPDYLARVRAMVAQQQRLPPEVEKVLAEYAAISHRHPGFGAPNDAMFSRSKDSELEGGVSKKESVNWASYDEGLPQPQVEEVSKSDGADYPNMDEIDELVGNASALSVLRNMHQVMVDEAERAERNHNQLMSNEKIVRRQSWAILVLTVIGAGFGLWDRLMPGHVVESLERIAVAIDQQPRSGQSGVISPAPEPEAPPQPAPTPVHAPADNAPSSSDRHGP